MDGPVVSFDVSKGESHMRAFESAGRPFGPVRRIPHSREGFGEAAELFGSLRGRTGLAPSAVYEATGVYAAPLLSFLRGLGCPVYRISPLESAKMRKAEIRPTKNDSLDTGTIAKVFYSREIRRMPEEDGLRLSLREMVGELQYRTAAAVAGKNRYRRLLDECWPLFDGVIEYDSDASLRIVARFGHPSRIRTAAGVLKATGRKSRTASGTALAERVLAYARGCVSGCAPDSYAAAETAAMASEVLGTAAGLRDLAGRMEALASALPEYALLMTIPQVGALTAAEIAAEIGDVGRFASGSALVAYCGLDPAVLQSGRQTGEHLGITKKGNARLRTVLYLAVGRICVWSPESKVARFVAKKKGGLCQKAARIAGCSKLVRIIYAMLTNGTVYSDD
jgi:transposase